MRASRAGRGSLASVVALTAWVIALWPGFARACTVCFGGKDSNWSAGFYAGTLLMLLLPPALVVGAGIVIYRATKRQEARRAARDASSAAVAAPPATAARAPSPLHLVR